MARKFFDLIRIKPSEISVLMLAFLGLVLSIFWWTVSFLEISDVEFKNSQSVFTEAALPYLVSAEAEQILEFRVSIYKTLFDRHFVRIIPDDQLLSLILNGQSLPLEELAKGNLADWEKGISYPLGRFLRPGKNRLALKVRNKGGLSGIDMYSDFSDRQGLFVVIFGLFFLVCALGVLLRRWGVRWKMLFMLFLGLAVWCVYALITPWNVRTYDVIGHIQYVEFLRMYWSIPNPYDGWQFYQPPLYYFFAAAVWNIFDFFGLQRIDILKVLQFQSLIYVFGFVAMSFMTICLATKDPARFEKDGMGKKDRRGVLLWTGLLTFWPSVVIHSARIGNDSLFYFLSAAAFYFVIRWWISDRIIYFRWAGFFAALGMLTKSNAIILFFLMGILFFVRWFASEDRRWRCFFRKIGVVWIFFIAVVLFNYTGPFFDMLSGKRSHLLVGNLEGISSGLKVDNKITTYLWFDVKKFLEEPYISTREDSTGRQFFWNFLLKTGLFGEFSFSYNNFVVALARGLSCGLIFIILFPLVGLLKRNISWPRFPCDFPMAVLTVLFLLSLMFFRMSAPFACAGDFRYILPILVPVLYFYCAAIDRYRAAGWHWAVWAGKIAGWGFCLLSGLFVILLVLQY